MPDHRLQNRVKPGRVKQVVSPANPIIKEIRGLALKKNRDSSGLFLSEGLKLITDAIDSGWTIRTLIHSKPEKNQSSISDAAAQCRALGADILEVSEKVLGAISRRDNPQTVIGVLEQRWVSPADLSKAAWNNKDVIVALDRIRDPGNLGTILRTCDAVGAKGLILVGDTTDPFSLDATRASMGSIFHVPITRMDEGAFLDWKKAYKGRLAGTHLEGAVDYRSLDWDASPTLLLMGNEQQGLTPALANECDDVVIIPMAGKADSLNLAIATGVMLFEIRRNALTMEGHSTAIRFERGSEPS